jgi:DNA-binding FrmR family transcriptional regulator
MHQTHPEISKRLPRATGHLEHVVEMLAKGSSCIELAQQLQAVEKAVGSAKKALIRDHIDHCLQESGNGKAKPANKKLVDEFRDIAKYL